MDFVSLGVEGATNGGINAFVIVLAHGLAEKMLQLNRLPAAPRVLQSALKSTQSGCERLATCIMTGTLWAMILLCRICRSDC